MNYKNLIGSWKLASFEIVKHDGTKKTWGSNPHGILIYTTEHTMSVSINSELSEEPNDLQTIFNGILFYAGSYQIKDLNVIHVVENATDPKRIGEKMIRKAMLTGNQLSLIAEGEYGRAILIWERIVPRDIE